MIMKLRQLTLLFGILLLSVGSLLAINPEETFREANQAYEQKKYDEAIALYEQLLSEEYRSSALLYNLGMACLEKNQLSKAVLYLERALLIRPGDEDVRHNLRIIKTQYLEDQLDVIPESFLLRWWKNAYQLTASRNWTILSVVFIWLAMIGLSVWRVGRSRNLRKWGFFLGISLFLVSLLLGNLAYSRYSYEYNNGRAVIMPLETSFRVAPDSDSELVAKFHAGTSCRVISELNSWYKVRLSDGQVGWIQKKDLRLI
jgi:tetratricopeptide (TPR) repeat protein